MTAERGEVTVHLAELLQARGMTLTALAEQVGMTLANASILKNGHAKAIRFSTLAALCDTLDCQPGDLLTWHR
ncbi:MAG: helix-turn-helix transcriptional regulator [Bifidobacteriaceae bacterium]|nr:helix-turn-helix transcriptional regulator [Bifidobacteriaceae bacterium]